jgi:hypothetical protein
MAPAKKKAQSVIDAEQKAREKRDYMSSYAKAHNTEDVVFGDFEVNEKKMDTTVNKNIEEASTSGLTEAKKDTNKSEFKMPEQAEQTLDMYISKLEEYHSKIGEEKTDVVNQKAKVLQAVLGTDMLKID